MQNHNVCSQTACTVLCDKIAPTGRKGATSVHDIHTGVIIAILSIVAIIAILLIVAIIAILLIMIAILLIVDWA